MAHGPTIASTPFSVAQPFSRPVIRAVMAAARPALDRVVGFAELARLYRAAQALDGSRSFAERALEVLEAPLSIVGGTESTIPAAGPLIVAANHPSGILDGLALIALLQRVRRDARVLANHLLGIVPDLRDAFILVDVYNKSSAVARNGAALRHALRWVRSGGALIVFPAGEVAHARSFRGTPVESPWHSTVAALVRQSGAPVLPVFVQTTTSRAWNVAGRLHPLLRTALLPRELLRAKGRAVRICIGDVIPNERVQRFTHSPDAAAYLRGRTLALGPDNMTPPEAAASERARHAPIVPRTPAAALRREIESIARSHTLIESNESLVLCARAERLKHTLHEIGRLREVAFRHVGEGTGCAIDLDRFDESYWHLFVWNRRDEEITGAYRVGVADELLEREGQAALYTSTLFRYQSAALEQIRNGLELGRSFVRLDRQRDFGSLLLLWRGIGRFVARQPHLRWLWGPVSISAGYSPRSRALIKQFLWNACRRADLADLVSPTHLPESLVRTEWDVLAAGTTSDDIGEIDRLVAGFEADGKGIPVLVRQYLKLDAKVLGFNVDRQFGNALDALMLVDLLDVSPSMLGRCMGRAEAATYLAWHRADDGLRAVS